MYVVLFIYRVFLRLNGIGGCYMSWKVIEVPEQEFLLLKEHNRPIEGNYDIAPNEGVEIRSSLGVLNCIFDSEVGIRRLNDSNPQFKSSKNRDLALLNDLLKNPKVNTITVDGFFGTGKTSTVMAHVVEYLKEAEKPHVYLSKPHVAVGNSYGHLPGELMDKISYEFKSFYQYLDRYWREGIGESLTRMSTMDIPKGSMFAKEMAGVRLEALPFEYIRGLDLENCWVLLDESQNTTLQEMVSFVSRLNSNVKFVALGDTTSAQIDRKSVIDPKKNGFAFLKSAYKAKSYSGSVSLTTRNHILRGDRVKHLHDAISSHQF